MAGSLGAQGEGHRNVLGFELGSGRAIGQRKEEDSTGLEHNHTDLCSYLPYL